jgi:hypothetical protein
MPTMSQGQQSRRRKTSIGEVLTKSRDYRLEQMKLELYDMPKAFFEDEVAQDYYDAAKKLINERHESAEAMFTELKEMITSGYRTGKKDGEREEGWNTKTNRYEFRTPREWARMQKRKGSKPEQDTTDDEGTVEATDDGRSLPLSKLKGIVDQSTLSQLEKVDKETLHESLPEEGKLEQIQRIKIRLQTWQEKIGMLLDDKDDENLMKLYLRLTERINEVDQVQRVLNTKSLIGGAKKEREKGKIVFKSFPTLQVPEHDATALPGKSYLEAVINGTNYRIYAGQNFLNTEYSQELYEKAPTKGGSIALYQGAPRYPDSEEYKCVVVGDAHHRFVWGAFHNQSLVGELIPQPFAQAAQDWSVITYKHNPKHEYAFDVNERSDPLKANANASVKKKLFLAAVSPRPEYAGKYAKSPEGFIQTHLAIFWKEIQKGVVLEERELKKVKKYLDDLVDKADPRPLDVAVKQLMSAAQNKEFAESMGSIILESMSGKLPTVALGAAQSVGYYDPNFNVIVLDPNKNKTPDALLDTLSFETGNAVRRDAFLDKENSTTNVEFGTMNDYVKILLTASKSTDINQLVEYLKIPKEYLEPDVAEEILKMEQPALSMPDENVMSEQKLRSALAWWKMKDWTEEERLKYFSKSAHAKGMAATGSEYKS